jgi:hypothetical protein
LPLISPGPQPQPSPRLLAERLLALPVVLPTVLLVLMLLSLLLVLLLVLLALLPLRLPPTLLLLPLPLLVLLVMLLRLNLLIVALCCRCRLEPKGRLLHHGCHLHQSSPTKPPGLALAQGPGAMQRGSGDSICGAATSLSRRIMQQQAYSKVCSAPGSGASPVVMPPHPCSCGKVLRGRLLI